MSAAAQQSADQQSPQQQPVDQGVTVASMRIVDGNLIVDADVDDDRGRPLHLRWRYLYVVFLGGVLGTMARWAVSNVFPVGHRWPWPTFLVNIVGAFCLGLLLESLVRAGSDHGWRRLARLHIGTGFLGAFTTYSSFAVEAVLLADQHHVGTAAAYLAASGAAGILAAALGVRMGTTRAESREAQSRENQS